MSEITIYHNPRCSKSRQTLTLLTEQGVSPEIVEYLKTPLDSEQIANLVEKLGFTSARELLRKGEQAYKDNNLASTDLTESQIIEAMVTHPKLIERPIVTKGEQAKIGRPPEAVLDLL
jgi:arsenate reductase